METCWVVGAADEVEEVGLPELMIVVEVGEGARVEEFEGIEVPVRVGAGHVGTDTAAGAGGVGAVDDDGTSSRTEEVVNGKATRTDGAVERSGTW